MFCSGEGSELPDSEFPVNSDLLTNRCSRPGAAHSGCFCAYSAGSRDSLSAAGGAVFVRGKFRVTESPTTRLMVPEIRVKPAERFPPLSSKEYILIVGNAPQRRALPRPCRRCAALVLFGPVLGAGDLLPNSFKCPQQYFSF